MTVPQVRVADEIARAARQLDETGVATARVDAEWLMCHVLDIDRGRLLIADDLSADAAARYRNLVDRRAQRIPLQHLTGSAAFGPLQLSVGPGVFVPRPETEWLLEWAVSGLSGAPAPVVVDLCSGSGALAIGVAALVPAARVFAVEKSPEAWEWLHRNIIDCEVADRCVAVCADVTDVRTALDALMEAGLTGPADLVVSNPPYVPEGTDTSAEVHWDPHAAVFGGDDGMSVITPMLPLIGALLGPAGRAGIEHDETTAPAVLAAAAAGGVFAEITGHDDLTGRPRFVTMTRASADTRAP